MHVLCARRWIQDASVARRQHFYVRHSFRSCDAYRGFLFVRLNFGPVVEPTSLVVGPVLLMSTNLANCSCSVASELKLDAGWCQGRPSTTKVKATGRYKLCVPLMFMCAVYVCHVPCVCHLPT